MRLPHNFSILTPLFPPLSPPQLLRPNQAGHVQTFGPGIT
jgi:hypothetical protein